MSAPCPKVLLVEDEKLIRRFVRVAIEEEGCHVVEAETMAQGLIEAGLGKPDLLILDLGLPDGNGIDLIRDLRGWSDVPILILSARAQEKDKIDALDAGRAIGNARTGKDCVKRAIGLGQRRIDRSFVGKVEFNLGNAGKCYVGIVHHGDLGPHGEGKFGAGGTHAGCAANHKNALAIITERICERHIYPPQCLPGFWPLALAQGMATTAPGRGFCQTGWRFLWPMRSCYHYVSVTSQLAIPHETRERHPSSFQAECGKQQSFAAFWLCAAFALDSTTPFDAITV